MIVIGQDQNICDTGGYRHDVCHTVEDENCACVVWLCERVRREIQW